MTQLTGLLKVKYDTVVVSEKFKKRDFVLTTEAATPYPQHVLLQLSQDKVLLIDNCNEGDELTVELSIRGREWNGPQGIKYFNTLEAWKVEKRNTQPEQKPIEQPNFDPNDDLPY